MPSAKALPVPAGGVLAVLLELLFILCTVVILLFLGLCASDPSPQLCPALGQGRVGIEEC